jgi:hypothetical protein
MQPKIVESYDFFPRHADNEPGDSCRRTVNVVLKHLYPYDNPRISFQLSCFLVYETNRVSILLI